MDDLPSSLVPGGPLSPPLPRPNKPELEPQDATDQRSKRPHGEDSNEPDDWLDPTPAIPSSNEVETERNDDDCQDMVEKWRLIRQADKNSAQKKIHPTHGLHTALFGEHYSKFYDAFKQGLSAAETRTAVATTVPAKRAAATPKQASKRRKRDDHASLPRSTQHHAPTMPVQTPAVATTTVSRRTKSIELASSSNMARETPVASQPRSDLETNEQRSRRRGTGLYAGNWEYVTDEEIVPEYVNVAQKIADLEGRTTRRAYAKLTSRERGEDLDRPADLPSEDSVRKSSRARNVIDYSGLSGPDDSIHEIITPKQTEEVDRPPAQVAKQLSPSTSASTTSNRSTLIPDHPSRSTSASTAMVIEQPERPNLSWNAIVYEVLATSDKALTFPQLMHGIRERYPFFKSAAQEKVLNSGVKNPLYFHEAFCKGDVVDGKQTWALKPGEWLDKKTGQVLTPRPRYTIPLPRLTEQAHETANHNPVDLTSELSHSYNPRSGNPRFGREILNSPEIPDSQGAEATTSSQQETDDRVATKDAPHLEGPTGTPELADAADDTSTSAFVETRSPGQTAQPRFHWATPTFSPINSTAKNTLPSSDGTNTQRDQSHTSTIDHEASAIAAQPNSAVLAVQIPSSIPSSTAESRRESSIITETQVASKSLPLMRAVSPTFVPSSLGDRGASSQTTSTTPPAPKLSVTSLAYPQLDLFPPEGKTGAKENAYVQVQLRE